MDEKSFEQMKRIIRNQGTWLLMITGLLGLLILALVRKGVLSGWDDLVSFGPVPVADA